MSMRQKFRNFANLEASTMLSRSTMPELHQSDTLEPQGSISTVTARLGIRGSRAFDCPSPG